MTDNRHWNGLGYRSRAVPLVADWLDTISRADTD
jgi:hypothetical protein